MWIPDDTEGFLAAWIKKGGNDNDQDSTAEVVVATSGETRTVPTYALSPMNPPQFDGVEDIADLTHLNEASVINNLRLRYGAGDIYVSRSAAQCMWLNLTLTATDILWVSNHLGQLPDEWS